MSVLKLSRAILLASVGIATFGIVCSVFAYDGLPEVDTSQLPSNFNDYDHAVSVTGTAGTDTEITLKPDHEDCITISRSIAQSDCEYDGTGRNDAQAAGYTGANELNGSSGDPNSSEKWWTHAISYAGASTTGSVEAHVEDGQDLDLNWKLRLFDVLKFVAPADKEAIITIGGALNAEWEMVAKDMDIVLNNENDEEKQADVIFNFMAQHFTGLTISQAMSWAINVPDSTTATVGFGAKAEQTVTANSNGTVGIGTTVGVNLSVASTNHYSNNGTYKEGANSGVFTPVKSYKLECGGSGAVFNVTYLNLSILLDDKEDITGSCGVTVKTTWTVQNAFKWLRVKCYDCGEAPPEDTDDPPPEGDPTGEGEGEGGE